MGTRTYAQWHGITYEELEGSPTYRCTRDSMTITQIIKVDWEDVDALLNALFPRVLVSSTSAWYYLSLPYYPQKPWCRVSGADVDPFDPTCPTWDAAKNMNTYSGGAKVTITYQTDKRTDDNEDDDGNQTIRSHRVSFGGEFIKLAQSGYYKSGDANKTQLKNEDINLAKMIPLVEHAISFYYVPTPPWATIADKIGKVNSAAEGLGVGAAAETVMFVGADANKQVTLQGDDAWQLDYRFSQRVVKDGNNTYGWNHFWIPGTDGGWTKLLSKDGDNPVYPSTTFTALFQNADAG